MEIVFNGSTSLTPEKSYPQNLVVIAQWFFRWLCERENERHSMRRFTAKELVSIIADHAEFTGILAVQIQRSFEDRSGIGREGFSKFCKEEKLDKEEFKDSHPVLDDLVLMASLQFHLAYHDLLSGQSRLKFHYPIFEEVWAHTRGEVEPPQERFPTEERRAPGRPGIDYDWIRRRLRKLEELEKLPFLEGHWRSTLAELLRSEYMNQYDGIKLKKAPQMETIRDRMRDEFDALQERDKMRNDFEALKGRYSKE